MDLAVDNKIQSGVDPEGGGCKCSMANNMSWSSQRRGRGRRRRWSMLNVLFICLLILVSAGMVSSGLVLRDVASEKEVENGGSIHGSGEEPVHALWFDAYCSRPDEDQELNVGCNS